MIRPPTGSRRRAATVGAGGACRELDHLMARLTWHVRFGPGCGGAAACTARRNRCRPRTVAIVMVGDPTEGLAEVSERLTSMTRPPLRRSLGGRHCAGAAPRAELGSGPRSSPTAASWTAGR